MAFELRQNLKLTQQLIMTPQLQQAIKLLQLSRLDLVDAVNQEIEENPLLEEVVSDDRNSTGTAIWKTTVRWGSHTTARRVLLFPGTT
jgi:RNA polymerase sigma-54 factor